MGRARASRGRPEVEKPCRCRPSSPLPASIEASAGAPFVLTDGVLVTGETDAAAALRGLLEVRTGLAARRRRRTRRRLADRRAHHAGRSPESYRIAVDEASVVITGADAAGAFYGVQTLGQLIAPRRRALGDPRGRDRRRPPLRLPWGDARRRASLPVRRHRHGVHRPRRRPEVQRPASAPQRRSGLADPARLPAEAHRAGVGDRRRRAIRADSSPRRTTPRSSRTRHPGT